MQVLHKNSQLCFMLKLLFASNFVESTMPGTTLCAGWNEPNGPGRQLHRNADRMHQIVADYWKPLEESQT